MMTTFASDCTGPVLPGDRTISWAELMAWQQASLEFAERCVGPIPAPNLAAGQERSDKP